ncbi:hypothetical protein Tco_0976179 [Tanacetum coccineum]|uniref:Uncharacterized protein n=1 Tax=Tanacetum coccineum TaxID=301880 RepID=A0ABQ5EHL5_9ASTR
MLVALRGRTHIGYDGFAMLNPLMVLCAKPTGAGGSAFLGCEPCRDPKYFWSMFDCSEFGSSLQLPYRFVFANYCLQSSSLPIHRLVEQRPVYALHTSVVGSGGKRTGPSVVEATTDWFELWRAKKSGSGGGEVNGHREAVPQFHDIDALTIMIDPSFNGQFRNEAVAGACVVFQLTDIAERLSDSMFETWQITTD